jgi:hypothetical protein
MLSATHNIIQEFEEVEYYVNIAPITKSALDLSDEIKEKFQVKVSPATISNYRKKMPKTKIKHLHEDRVKNIKSLQLIVKILEDQLENIVDSALKLRYIQEISNCIREMDFLIENEIKYQKNFSSY